MSRQKSVIRVRIRERSLGVLRRISIPRQEVILASISALFAVALVLSYVMNSESYLAPSIALASATGLCLILKPQESKRGRVEAGLSCAALVGITCCFLFEVAAREAPAECFGFVAFAAVCALIVMQIYPLISRQRWVSIVHGTLIVAILVVAASQIIKALLNHTDLGVRVPSDALLQTYQTLLGISLITTTQPVLQIVARVHFPVETVWNFALGVNLFVGVSVLWRLFRLGGVATPLALLGIILSLANPAVLHIVGPTLAPFWAVSFLTFLSVSSAGRIPLPTRSASIVAVGIIAPHTYLVAALLGLGLLGSQSRPERTVLGRSLIASAVMAVLASTFEPKIMPDTAGPFLHVGIASVAFPVALTIALSVVMRRATGLAAYQATLPAIIVAFVLGSGAISSFDRFVDPQAVDTLVLFSQVMFSIAAIESLRVALNQKNLVLGILATVFSVVMLVPSVPYVLASIDHGDSFQYLSRCAPGAFLDVPYPSRYTPEYFRSRVEGVLSRHQPWRAESELTADTQQSEDDLIEKHPPYVMLRIAEFGKTENGAFGHYRTRLAKEGYRLAVPSLGATWLYARSGCR